MIRPAPWRAVVDRVTLGLRLAWAARRARRAATEADRRAAHATVAGLLAEARGAFLKAGQIAAGLTRDSPLEALAGGVPARPLDEIRPAVEAALGRPLADVFSVFEEAADAASLGQVHRARLLDGAEVAVKVRYPGIERAVAAEVRLAGWMPAAGPARRWGFDLEGYRRLLGETLAQELDYRGEAERQRRFGERVKVPGLVVPRVFAPWCRSELLVQSWEDGEPLREAAGWPLADRLRLGQTALRTFFVSLFTVGEVHADPHPGNLRCRRGEGGPPELVLYDYGCTLRLDERRRAALLRLILACREADDGAVAPALVALGFDPARLLPIAGDAAGLCRLVLEPWLEDRPFDPGAWRVRERSERLLGELRWWFRAAAPPDLLLFVRAFFGLVRQIELLEVRLPWWPVLIECLGPAPIAAARSLALEPPPIAPAAQGRAHRLRVEILEGGRELFGAALPASDVFDLEGRVPGAVRDRLAETGVRLARVVREVRRRGVVPQELFTASVEGRTYRAWLE